MAIENDLNPFFSFFKKYPGYFLNFTILRVKHPTHHPTHPGIRYFRKVPAPPPAWLTAIGTEFFNEKILWLVSNFQFFFDRNQIFFLFIFVTFFKKSPANI